MPAPKPSPTCHRPITACFVGDLAAYAGSLALEVVAVRDYLEREGIKAARVRQMIADDAEFRSARAKRLARFRYLIDKKLG